MDHRIHQLSHHQLMLNRVKQPAPNKTSKFEEILAGAQELRISSHAKQRMNQRNIEISNSQWNTITEKVMEAKQKGVTDSLVLTDEAALLVSAKNHTVVTVMKKDEAASKIFTNINGTILIQD